MRHSWVIVTKLVRQIDSQTCECLQGTKTKEIPKNDWKWISPLIKFTITNTPLAQMKHAYRLLIKILAASMN